MSSISSNNFVQNIPYHSEPSRNFAWIALFEGAEWGEQIEWAEVVLAIFALSFADSFHNFSLAAVFYLLGNVATQTFFRQTFMSEDKITLSYSKTNESPTRN